MAFFSTNSSDYANAINALTKPTYTSQYGTQIQSLMDKIVNKKDFSYDFNADPLYQNYKDQYTKLGNEASLNAASNVASLTGGYGNSYAATAATQANQQYLTQLNNVIPELAQAALNKYNLEKEDLYNQFNMYQGEENRLYGQYRDNVSDYYQDYSNLSSGYSTALDQENWQKEYDLQLSKLNAASSASGSGSGSTSASTAFKNSNASSSAYVAAYTDAIKKANEGLSATDIAKNLAANKNLTGTQQKTIQADVYAVIDKLSNTTKKVDKAAVNPNNKNQSKK